MSGAAGEASVRNAASPNPEAQPRRGRRWLAGSLLVLASAAALALGGGAWWVNRILDRATLAATPVVIDSRMQVASSRLTALSRTLENTREGLSRLQQVEWKTRVINGLGAPPLAGTQGDVDPSPPPSTLFGLSFGPRYPDVMERAGACGDQARALAVEVRRLRTSYEEVVRRMVGEEDVWAGIPSLFPMEHGHRETSHFGRRRDPFTHRWAWHEGMDFTAPTGTPILATAAGRVSKAGWFGGYGKMVEIDHGNGLTTRYAHTSKILVKPGDRVERGTVLAFVGRTGRASAPHLHYEVRLDGVPVNPKPYIFQDFLAD